ncbi:MAG TPA: hypothetical protein PKC67_06970 [Kiritimatiellia bacterium]|nr:hypothetical protein [Kiritimatiellia bacterium]HMP34079.1 hypothetical protein [Kiritimatiellia bacterium]
MSPEHRRLLLTALLLACASVLPFLHGLPHAWTYDDHGVIVENTFLADPAAARRLLTLGTVRDPSVVDGQRPVVVLSYLADRARGGLDPATFRATNLLLHAAATLLVFALFRRLLDLRLAALASLLFAWHPLNVEAVIAPAFREDLLYVVPGLAFLLLGWCAVPSRTRHVAAVLCLVAALLAKEAAAALPLVLLAGWWWQPSWRPPRRTMIAFAAWSFALTVIVLVFLLAGRPAQGWGEAWNGVALRGAEGWRTAPWLAVHQLVRAVWPHPLSVDYVIAPVAAWSEPRGWAPLAVLAALALALVHRRTPAAVALGLAWFVLFFAPVSNLLPLYNPVADRYAYGILPGLVLAFAAGLARWPRVAVPALVVLALAAGVRSTARVADWRDDRTLWTAALSVEPRSARAHTWIALEEKRAGHRDEAWRLLIEAERLNPHDVAPLVNRAILLGEAGDLTGAELLLREALARRPGHEHARRNLDLCLSLQGRAPEDAGPAGSPLTSP